MQSVAQILFDAMLRTPHHGVANRVRLKLLAGLRRLLIRMGDPLVRYQLDGTAIMLPLSHHLPMYRQAFPQYASNVARVAQHVAAKYSQLTFIDIGANVGDTVAILRGAARFPILCIEGDDRFFALLRLNTARLHADIYLERAFVGSMTGEIQGHIESHGGTAHLITDETSGQMLRVKRLSDILSRRPSFAQAKMIKLDTDGFDCRILLSEREWLAQLKPVIFFEYDPHDFNAYVEEGFTIFQSLQEIGYSHVVLFENSGDYLLTAELDDRPLVEDVHQFYSGRAGKRYLDVCAFHAEDFDVCQQVRLGELEFSSSHLSRRSHG